MFCPKCGTKLSDDAKFCSGCGAPVGGAAVQNNQTANVPVTNVPASNVQNAAGNAGGNDKKKKGSFVKKLLIGVAAVLVIAVAGTAGFVFIGGEEAVEGTFLAKILPQSNKDSDDEGRLTRTKDKESKESSGDEEKDNAAADQNSEPDEKNSSSEEQGSETREQSSGTREKNSTSEEQSSESSASREKDNLFTEKNTRVSGEQDLMARVAGAYEILSQNFNPSDMGGELAVSIELGSKGETLMELLGDQIGIDLSKITKAGITADYKLSTEMAEIDLTAILNKDDLLSANVIYDETNHKLYARMPELGSEYLSVGIPVEEQYLVEIQETVSELFAVMPQDSEIERILRTYGEIIVNSADDFGKEEKAGQTLTVAGVSQSCTEVTLKITEDSLESLRQRLSDQIGVDQDLKNIIKRMMSSEYFAEEGFDENEAIEELQDELEYLFDDLKEVVAGEENEVLEVKYYKDNDKIIGFETEITYQYYDYWMGQTITEMMPYSFLTAQNGDSIGCSINVGGIYAVTGSGVLKNDLLTADFSVRYSEDYEIASVSVKDWNIGKLQDMEFSGEFTVAPGQYLVESAESNGEGDILGMFKLKNCKVKVRIDAGPEKFNCGVTFVYRDDDYVTADFSWKNTHNSRINRPKDSDLVPIEDDEDLVNWMKTAKWDNAIEKLDNSALPDEVVSLLRDMTGYLKDGDLDGFEDYWDSLGGSAAETTAAPDQTTSTSAAPNY